jgi:predicted dithiol-disulfide oxidoreductase (DUF899 family)
MAISAGGTVAGRPAASAEYTAACAELRRAEREALAAAARVAELRARLPAGPVLNPSVPLTTAGGKPVTLAGLLGRRRALLALHLDLDEGADPATANALPWADALDPVVPLLRAAGPSTAEVAVLAPAAPGVLDRVARERGWRWLRPVSTQPGALTDLLGVRDSSGALAPAVSTVLLGPDGVLRLHWQGAGDALDALDAAAGWRALLPANAAPHRR